MEAFVRQRQGKRATKGVTVKYCYRIDKVLGNGSLLLIMSSKRGSSTSTLRHRHLHSPHPRQISSFELNLGCGKEEGRTLDISLVLLVPDCAVLRYEECLGKSAQLFAKSKVNVYGKAK